MKIGEVFLGKYQILERLGSGGMGEVWKAHDTVAGVDVAIKAVPRDVSFDPSEMAEIRVNFQLVRRLTHPNVVALRALEQDPTSGAYFVVQDFVPGMNLKAYRRSKAGGKLPLAEAVRIAGEMAKALDYAHQERIVHRDVKPENVMVTPDGRVLVTDFGLAMQILTSISRVSKEHYSTSGTRPYMAPEQWEGKRQDAATDQYSFAVVFHELVSGGVPFENADVDVLRGLVLDRRPEPLPQLTRSQNAALGRALAKRRKERFPSCGAFVSALRGERPPLPGRVVALIAVAIVVATAIVAAAAGIWGHERWKSGLSRAAQALGARLAFPPAVLNVSIVSFGHLGRQGKTEFSERLRAELENTLGDRRDVTIVENQELERLATVLKAETSETWFRAADELLKKIDFKQTDAVVLGNYYVDGDSVRILARVVGAGDRGVLDTADYDLPMTAEISKLLGAAPEPGVKPPPETSKPTASPSPTAPPGPTPSATLTPTPAPNPCPAETVSAPTAAKGPPSVEIGKKAEYCFSGAKSSCGHGVQYCVDWDDDQSSGWLAAGKSCASHAWSGPPDTHRLMVVARCSENADVQSAGGQVSLCGSASVLGTVSVAAPPTPAPTPSPTPVPTASPTVAPAAAPAAVPAPVSKGGDMVSVPAGEFQMGSNDGEADEKPDEKPAHTVYLDAFQIDRTEVTVAQYGSCVSAGRCSQPNTDGSCNWGKSDRGNHPVNCIDWNQAKTYCEWAGKRLPTEAEWEKAARGTDGRKYPWGSQPPTCDYAVMDSGGNGCGRNSTWPVGSKPAGASPYGALDMAGNVWEWVADWYADGYYTQSPSRNPKGPASGSSRVVRGGSWIVNLPRFLRGAYRIDVVPSVRNDYIGARCARDGN